MDELEYLCSAFGEREPGRIGIMDSGKSINLGTLQKFCCKSGESLLIKQVGEHWKYLFFPTLREANNYLNQLNQQIKSTKSTKR